MKFTQEKQGMRRSASSFFIDINADTTVNVADATAIITAILVISAGSCTIPAAMLLTMAHSTRPALRSVSPSPIRKWMCCTPGTAIPPAHTLCPWPMWIGKSKLGMKNTREVNASRVFFLKLQVTRSIMTKTKGVEKC